MKGKDFLILIALVVCISANPIPEESNISEDINEGRLPDNRIVGGEDTRIEKFPYQVTLRFKYFLTPQFPYAHQCGGSIYSDRIIISAAHCVIATVPSQWQIVVGTSQRRGNDGLIVPVQEIIMHENFNPANYTNDIAILVAGAPLTLNNYTIKAIELTEGDSYIREGKMATVTGWGALSAGGFSPDILQEVQVPIISNENCSIDYHGRVDETMICAGYRGVGEKDACQGDSGGPLVVDGKLTGVVSWGSGCAQPEWPGVYANITHLRPWLLNKISQIKFD